MIHSNQNKRLMVKQAFFDQVPITCGGRLVRFYDIISYICRYLLVFGVKKRFIVNNSHNPFYDLTFLKSS